MIFKTKEFNVMQQGMDALWLKQQVQSNNIANYETPGYKAQRVTFQEVLNNNLNESGQLQATITTDQTTSSRVDGNNVDLDKESLDLWQTYAQYTYLAEKINAQFSDMRYVIQSFK